LIWPQGAQNVTVPREWTRCSVTYCGEGFCNAPGKHRTGAEAIGMLILANYQQDSQAILQMKNPAMLLHAPTVK
jgi:hypothetical protein